MNIILVGFKNSGKTSVGKVLAKKMNYQFIDSDHKISDFYEAEHGVRLSSSEIYRKVGGDFFRSLESQVLLSLDGIEDSIISTGGGSVLSEVNRDFFKKMGVVVYLKISKDELIKRFNNKANPMFLDKDNKEAGFDEMFEHRKPLYELMADKIIDVDFKGSEEIANKIIEMLGENNGL